MENVVLTDGWPLYINAAFHLTDEVHSRSSLPPCEQSTADLGMSSLWFSRTPLPTAFPALVAGSEIAFDLLQGFHMDKYYLHRKGMYGSTIFSILPGSILSVIQLFIPWMRHNKSLKSTSCWEFQTFNFKALMIWWCVPSNKLEYPLGTECRSTSAG